MTSALGFMLQETRDLKSASTIHDYAAEGLWPFKPKHIEVMLEYLIDYNVYAVHVDAYFGEYLSEGRVHAIAHVPREMEQLDPNSFPRAAGMLLLEAFRFNFDTEPIPSNIDLGEE